MSRESLLFDIGNPEEKLEAGFCPIGRCATKKNTGFTNNSMDPKCCCHHCWIEKTGGNRTCDGCPAEGEEEYDGDG